MSSRKAGYLPDAVMKLLDEHRLETSAMTKKIFTVEEAIKRFDPQ
jgi:glutamyl/glutaminyl-tRNA synthetase